MPNNPSLARRWLNTIGEIAAVVLVVTVAKSAIAEPYYVPSGSMEPTLLIGDELLATKFPYGYSSASLPLSIAWPRTRAHSRRAAASAATWSCSAIRATARRSGSSA